MQSFLFCDNFDVKAISEHLWHCNTAITSDIYTHIFKEYKAKIAESIENTSFKQENGAKSNFCAVLFIYSHYCDIMVSIR